MQESMVIVKPSQVILTGILGVIVRIVRPLRLVCLDAFLICDKLSYCLISFVALLRSFCFAFNFIFLKSIFFLPVQGLLVLREHILKGEIEMSQVDIDFLIGLHLLLLVLTLEMIDLPSMDNGSVRQLLEYLHLLFQKRLNCLRLQETQFLNFKRLISWNEDKNLYQNHNHNVVNKDDREAVINKYGLSHHE